MDHACVAVQVDDPLDHVASTGTVVVYAAVAFGRADETEDAFGPGELLLPFSESLPFPPLPFCPPLDLFEPLL